MSPLIGEPPGPTITRLVSLGPVTLPTLKGDVSETLGDQLETIGAGVVAGERRPRPLPLTFPVRGDYLDNDRYDAGLRLRRQVRALIENAPARLQGLYLDWSVDPEQNCWLLVGGGDLKPVRGGITFADFEIELTDCYRIGNQRTHRPARRLTTLDRRAGTTPRDILGTQHSTDFASSGANTWHFLGVGITDPVSGPRRAPATLSSWATRDGNLSLIGGGVDGDIVDFEQRDGDMHKATVAIHDTHGSVVETDWEPVYGPDQPLSGTPVLDNAMYRVVPAIGTGRLDVQTWSPSGWVTDATVAHPPGATAFRARVVEWTSERGVICITSILAAGVRGELYVTLQRGWHGLRFELYATNIAGTATATLQVHAKTVGEATYQRSNHAIGGSSNVVAGETIGTFTGLQPWVALLGPGTDQALDLAVLQAAINLRGAILDGREGLAFEGPAGYASVTLATGARATARDDATNLGALNLTDARTVPEIVARG